MAVCSAPTFSLPVEQHIALVPPTVPYDQEIYFHQQIEEAAWTPLTNEIESHLQQEDVQKMIANAAWNEATTPVNLCELNFSDFEILPLTQEQMDVILRAQAFGTELTRYLDKHGDYDPSYLAHLIREADYIPSKTLRCFGDVSLPEACILYGWIEPFEACAQHDLLESIGTKSRHLLQIACDTQFVGNDLKQITSDRDEMPDFHLAKHIAPQDMFIAIILLDMIVAERDWRNVKLTPEAVARVTAVEAQLFTPSRAKL